MTLTESAIAKALSGKRVLIVEDDTPLAQRVARLLKAKTGIDPVVVGCMEAARLGVAEHRFDLGIVDCMIPRSLQHQQRIQDLDRAIRRARTIIQRIDPSTENEREEDELARAKDARAEALAEIDRLIVPDGGIQLVREWRGDTGSGPAQFPILYLTAVSAKEKRGEGQVVAGQTAEWLVKPVSTQDILKTCATLLKTPVSARKE